MKLKINQNLKGANDKPLLPALLFKDVIERDLLSAVEGEKVKEKLEKYELWRKVKSCLVEVELTIEEIALIKKLIGDLEYQLVMGQCFEFLEQKEKK